MKYLNIETAQNHEELYASRAVLNLVMPNFFYIGLPMISNLQETLDSPEFVNVPYNLHKFLPIAIETDLSIAAN